MSKIINAALIDDLDGQSPADGTVTFGLDGATYEIDLTEANQEKLRKVLEKYVSKARRVKSKYPSRSSRRASREANAGLRAWAAANGKKIGTRGRISEELRREYKLACAK